jgi:signal transduction histidine kinase
VSSPAETEGLAPTRSRWGTVLWVGAAAIFTIEAVVGLVFLHLNGESVAQQVPLVIAIGMFLVVGAIIVSRDPRNVIGLILLWTAAVTPWAFAASEVTTWLARHGYEGAGPALIGFMNNLGWLFGILPMVLLLPLLFPDGRLPSRRWRPILWVIGGMLALLFISLLLGQRTFTGSNDVDGVLNPFYIPAIGQLPKLDPLVAFLFPAVFLAAVVSLFLRFRRSTGVARQQIKWVAFGFAFAFVGTTVGGWIPPGVVNSFVMGIGFLAFPLSIGIAVLRFHLYDLDVVVKKTVIYAALALFATIVYLALVVGLGATFGHGSPFLTMVAAVVVAVTFQPVRARMTRFANRIVYGKRATPYEVLTEFSERVGDAYADEDVLPRMARALGEGIGAERADVWLAVDHELRDVAAWPSEEGSLAPVPLPNGSVPALDGADRVYPVEHAGELLGALAVRKPASDPVSPSDEKLMGDLAGQAGLVLRNVRLTEELKVRFEELKAAQKRLVSAQDEERRKLERNIHDGAQQQLVALQVRQRLVEQLIDPDPAKAKEMVAQLQVDTGTALGDLRDLARGIYPPLLADEGLAAALGAQARRATLPVTVEAEGVGRFPQAVEAAVYFSILEALQNVAKYAAASSANVWLSNGDGELRFEVRDDGNGFDPARTGYGTGLQGIADRLGALDGTLSVRSAPGAGAAISGSIPVVPLAGRSRADA